MNPLIFFTAFLGVFILLHIYISRRFIAHLDIKPTQKFYFRIFLFVNFFGIIFYMLGRYYIDIPNWLYFLFSLPIGVLFLLFCTAIIYDISRYILKKTPISKRRRDFFKRSLDISSLALASTLSAKSIYNASDIKLEEVDIGIKKLKKPYKIAQLSDIHIGGLIDRAFIKDLVKRVNALDVDLVVITGDLVDIDMRRAKSILEELKALKSTYGTFFVAGNHEYFHDIATILETLKELDIRVLENENVYIGDRDEGFNLAGVYDVFGYRVDRYIPDINKALKSLRASPTVLLAHQPRYIEEVTDSVDLMLSGHTHGGQLFPFRFLVKLQQPYISGLHQHNKELQIYVNKGTGFWGPPMRLGASSEITYITLIPAT